jgi:hypothetical protein
MNSASMSRTAAVGSVMGAATAFRVGASCLALWSKQAPQMLDLWLKAGEDTKAANAAERKLRDEVIKTARDTSDRVHGEVVRGINHVDRFTKRG